jgi:phosphoglycerol transferase MdoB-like AlkP superfamily enzyme
LAPARPNILVIILESFTSKIIGPLGGLSDITPNFNRLIREGILFDNFYASGDRTDKGLVSVLSGYPAQPLSSIINYPEKTQHLPHLSRFLQKMGYHNSFVYGGDIGFANMESYLTTGGFSNITEDDAFAQSLDNSKWGVPDHYVFERLLQECDTALHPFFKVMLSLSSHEPFEVPMETVIQGGDERSLFLNACYYTDKSLGTFIEQAKQRPWWNTTMVLITSDHGHRLPNSSQELNEKDRFKIPMLWLGGALIKRDTVVHTLAGQTDIANTLLAQLDGARSDFKFSKNILDKKARPFAIYVFNNGYGYIDPSGESIYDFDLKNFIGQAGQENLKEGKAYMQSLFNDYNAK